VPPAPDGTSRPPVFILTAARSGSTLLRFILDTHPDLACPPETDVGVACGNLAHAWEVIGRAMASRGGLQPQPGSLPAGALPAVREAADAILDAYLHSTGKRQVCDKSLSTIYYAGLMAEIYPEARFICLYRHCMDVITSYVSAMPWGLGEPAPGQPAFLPMHGYVARNPGNSVAAVAEYWLDCARRAADFEERHPGRCLRVRYEDLVENPEGAIAGVLSFLGLAPDPGIVDACFRTSHDRGPSDFKIWNTRRVQRNSVGSGVIVPAARLAGPVREGVNDMLSALGYRTVDEQWNASAGRRDPRAGTSHRASA
jgi:protein-tyrosine sulfotransferase